MNNNDSIKSQSRTIDVDNIHSNITPEILEITIDKLRIILLQNEKDIGGENAWQTPLALLITIVVVLCTAEFKEFFLIKAEVWSAIFIMSFFISAGWLIYSLIKMKRRMSFEGLIECMKKTI